MPYEEIEEIDRVEPVLSYDKCVLLKDHNTVTPVRLEPAAPRSRVRHSTTEPLRSHVIMGNRSLRLSEVLHKLKNYEAIHELMA